MRIAQITTNRFHLFQSAGLDASQFLVVSEYIWASRFNQAKIITLRISYGKRVLNKVAIHHIQGSCQNWNQAGSCIVSKNCVELAQLIHFK